jgi:hypothetical protein
MLAGHVAAALRAHGLGDRITWDVTLQLVPTPAGPRPMAAVYIHTFSAVLGELCGEVVLIEPQHLSAENIERNVRAALLGMPLSVEGTADSDPDTSDRSRCRWRHLPWLGWKPRKALGQRAPPVTRPGKSNTWNWHARELMSRE